MKTWWWILALAAAACAARQPTTTPSPEPWTSSDTAKLRGQCLTGFVNRGGEATSADAVCRCFVSHFTEEFPRTWLDDGQPVKPVEAESISRMVLTCQAGIVGSPSAQDDELVVGSPGNSSI